MWLSGRDFLGGAAATRAQLCEGLLFRRGTMVYPSESSVVDMVVEDRDVEVGEVGTEDAAAKVVLLDVGAKSVWLAVEAIESMRLT